MNNEIEQKIERILTAHGVKSAPVPVEEIAKQNDISIAKAPSDKFSGLLFRKENGPAFIALNSSESPVRQRFTIAHELGHYFLHPNKTSFVDYRDNKKNILRGPKEVQANQFAAALLMPKRFLEKDVVSFASEGLTEENVALLATRYNVSEDAMKFRLMNLHLGSA
jgi:Zn-dependent peptidase ImmA (M78 family)